MFSLPATQRGQQLALRPSSTGPFLLHARTDSIADSPARAAPLPDTLATDERAGSGHVLGKYLEMAADADRVDWPVNG